MYTMTKTTLEDLKPFLSLLEDKDGKQVYALLNNFYMYVHGEEFNEMVNTIEVSDNDIRYVCVDLIIVDGTVDNIECAVFQKVRVI
jgi:hypothetical protein